MEIIQTGIPDLLLVKPKVFADSRGSFFELFQENRYKSAGINVDFVQDNISKSSQGVLRGLHFQTQNAQDKLVSVIVGEVFDVAVDVRKNSPTFGKWYGCLLNETNHHQLFVPKGFAHGFYVLSYTATFHYKCSNYYSPEYEAGIAWNDTDLNISWPIQHTPIISAKDALHPHLAKVPVQNLPNFII